MLTLPADRAHRPVAHTGDAPYAEIAGGNAPHFFALSGIDLENQGFIAFAAHCSYSAVANVKQFIGWDERVGSEPFDFRKVNGPILWQIMLMR